MKSTKTPSRPDPALEDAHQPTLTYEKSLRAKVAGGSEAKDIVDQAVLLLAGQLVTQLHILLKTARLHDRTNAALNQPVDALQTLIKTLGHDGGHDGPVVLRLQNDFLFLDDMHLKMNSQQFALFMEFNDSLNARSIGAISFAPDVESADLLEFAYLFVMHDPATGSFATLQQQLKDKGLQGIQIEEATYVTIKVGEKHREAKLLARNSYVKAAETVGEVTSDISAGRPPNFRKAKRVIQNIVDLMTQDESILLGLTTLRCYDQYTHNHSVNVSLLSISLGNRVGYPKTELAALGLAALFHDMGKASLPLEVLNKPGEFTDEDWRKMRSHPTEGVIAMVKLRGVDHLPARMAAAAFEHHQNYDFSGYPKLTIPWKQLLTGRILTIADCYDAMTSSRVYRREPMSPEKVLKIMFSKSGQLFDPVLLKLFVNAVGILPIGSLVLLDTNELAVVVRPAQKREDAERPWVKIITDAGGNPIEGPDVDLTEVGPSGEYTRSVVRLVDNTEYKFDTSRYFV